MTSTVIDAVRAIARLSRAIERASEGLSLADYRVLSAIVGGEERASRLATRLALGRPAVSSSVDSLCRRGLVLRSSVDGDNRAIALSLTADGTELFERVEARMAERLELLSAGTPDAESVIQSLSWLGEAIEAEKVARVEPAGERREVNGRSERAK